MDRLTPRKIQRMLNIAEDKKSFPNPTIGLINDNDDLHRVVSQAIKDRSMLQPCESSSGIYDLDQLPGFEEIENFSPSLCTSFNPVEITGRSTDADNSDPYKLPDKSEFGPTHRKSLASVLEAQSSELPELMRHSVAVDMSFHSRRDLTADEVSLIAREMGLPCQQVSLPSDLTDVSTFSNKSMGSYFGKRCTEFGKVLTNVNSPDRSYMMPSITEVSQNPTFDLGADNAMDDTLDCIPVRQSDSKPRSVKVDKVFKIPNKPVGEYSSKSTQKNVGSNKLSVNTKPVYSVPQKTLTVTPQPAEALLKNLNSSFKQISEDTGDETSLSLSKIADYLGKQSNISVTDMLQLNKTKDNNKNQPLAEISMNVQKKTDGDFQVTMLKDTRKAETTSSVGTVETVLCVDKLKIGTVPQVLVTDSEDVAEVKVGGEKTTKHLTRSKSPSSGSHSTATTVKDQFSSFKSGDSPLQSSQGEANRSNIPSPNLEYKELDKSVDWQDVLKQKRLKRESIAKEQWAEVMAPPVEGFVGVVCAVTIKVTTLTDSWLTARFQFDGLPNQGKDLNIELPRLPLLLSPGKSEQFTLYLSSNVEMNTVIPFTVFLKDTSIEGEVAQKGNLKVNFSLPVIQAMSSSGVNKVKFPPILEKRSEMKCFVLISDCPVDLQLELSIEKGESSFNIRNVQEVQKSHVNKILFDAQSAGQALGKSKAINKQLCRLTKGNAIKVTVVFNAPRKETAQFDQDIIVKGILNVNLFGTNSILRRVELNGVVGYTKLVIDVPEGKIHLSDKPTSVSVSNSGSIAGIWRVKTDSSVPFRTHPETFELSPGGSQSIKLTYTGADDCLNEGTVVFEEIATGIKTKLQVTGGTDKVKFSHFPIKTNHSSMSWVRAGMKEISLLNVSDAKVQIRCKIVGDAFSIDKLGVETKMIICITFGPQEKRTLPIIFSPNTSKPYAAVLKISVDKDSNLCRKITLFGCDSGGLLRWSGLATYGNTALVRAVIHSPIELKLYNKSTAPAFVCARLQFNLHYLCVSGGSQVVGSHAVVGPRAAHRLIVRLEWARVERRARQAPPAAPASLATVTLLTGAEITRRRILRIIRNESTGELDSSLLPENLRALTDKFEGEDPTMDLMLKEFNEPAGSLEEVIDGLEELTAQIDLPQDFADENDTIVIADETVVAYHTLCE